MTTNLIPFQQAQAPAFLQQLNMTPEQVAAMNAGAAVGTGGGGSVNKISLKQSRFRLVVGGTETQVLPVLNLQLVVVRVNDGISKAFYLKEWNPGEENQAPDCSSDDGVRPRADSPSPQCGADGTCQNCPQNQWGSKINRLTGGKVKACSDTKRLAIIAPDAQGRFAGGGDLYQLSIPPASLQDFGTFVRQLQTLPTPVPYNAVVTDVAFDTSVSYPKLLFKGVRYLEPDEYAAIQGRYDDDDTKRVAGLAEVQVMRTAQQPQQQLAAPVQQAQIQHQPQVQQQAPVQQVVSQGYVDPNAGAQAAGGWGQPVPVQQAPMQQAPVQQQAAPAGWGQPAPVEQAQVQQQVQTQPQAAAAQQRQPGKPSPGKSRRSPAEMAEDEAYFAAQGGQAPAQQQVQVQQAPVQQQTQAQPQVQQAAPAGWGQPVPVQQAPVEQVQQAPAQQQAAPAGWGQPAPVQQVQQAQVQQPAFDQNNPFANAPGVVQQGAPLQPGVVEVAGVFGGWDDAPQQ